MTVVLNLKPEVEEDLRERARAAGLSLDQFLTTQLESLATASTSKSGWPHTPEAADQWEKELDAWLDSFPQQPVLSEDALKRETWYPDRW